MSKTSYLVFYLLLFLVIFAAAAVILFPAESLQTASYAAQPPTLVIDAGHGGEDGGAVAADGTEEAVINLAICSKIKALADFCGVEAVMTRQSDNIDYPAEAKTLSQMKIWDQHQRLAQINSTPNAVFLSIHQNKFSSSAPWGAQVFYGSREGSALLAETIQSNLTACLMPQNRREADRIDENIYLMNHADCCSVLVECGFLSNYEELAKLKTEAYQLSLATVIFSSFMQYIQGYEL